jgi:hypothetical protein
MIGKTAAINQASKAVSAPIGQDTSWHLYGPYDMSDLDGPSTEITADSYWHARAERTAWVAQIALRILGMSGEDADYAVHTAPDKYLTTVRAIVDAYAPK